MGTGSHGGGTETVLVMGMLLLLVILLILMGVVGMVMVKLTGVMRIVLMYLLLVGLLLTLPLPPMEYYVDEIPDSYFSKSP